MHEVSKKLQLHYAKLFSLHGPSPLGVDWGNDEAKALLRYEKMLNVLNKFQQKPSMMDVGCGYGGLYQYALSKNIDINYTGIDVADNMVNWAISNLPSANFICADVLAFEFREAFDYVVCNGILTQKLSIPALQMDEFAAQLIRRLFSLCRIGIAFNVMSTKVNYFSNNLYYRNPAELLAWCLAEISPHIRIDHGYPLFEYTVYLYRQPQP